MVEARCGPFGGAASSRVCGWCDPLLRSAVVAPESRGAGTTAMNRATSAPTLPSQRASGAKSPRPAYLLSRDEHGKPLDERTKRRVTIGTPVPPHLHPTKCGIPGKLYSAFDYLTPICDSISQLHDKAYGSGMSRLVQREERRRVRTIMDSAGAPGSSALENNTSAFEEYGINQYATNMLNKPTPLKPGELCTVCRTTNPGSQRVDERTKHLVCEECGAEGERYSYGADYKETNYTDKSTARADHPVKERQDPTFVNLPKTGTVISSGAKRKNKLGVAQELINKQTEREETNLSRGNQRKLTAIIESIDGMLIEMAPVDDAISRRVRMDASAVFCASVAHNEKCKKKECQKALFDKPTRVIARESFSYSIDQMSAGNGIDGVSKQKVVALQERVQSSLVFSHRENATQHQSCRAMIAAISTGDNAVECPSVEEEDLFKTPEQKSAGPASTGVLLARQSSDVQSSPIMQMRDQISRLSIVYSFPSQVQSTALLALTDGAFFKAITDQPIAPSNKPKEASAYLLLHSIAEETGVASSDPSNEQCRRVGLDGIDTRPIINRVRSILPNTAFGATAADDDELY